MQANLSRQTLVEVKILQEANQELESLKLKGEKCGCLICILHEICHSLKRAGYNCTICKSKWKEYGNLGGQHTYIEVITKDEESSKKKRDSRIIIDLNFREEFMIIWPTNEYNYLVSLLPNVFVGKAEKLRNVVKIMCSALEICMKKKKMHMGLWRTENYMQKKWKGRPEDSVPQKLFQILPMDLEQRKSCSKLSLLTLQFSKP